MSLDYMNNKNNKFKAFGGFIFGGSASIAVMQSGYYVDKVLEMTDDMLQNNAYHFHKNFPDVNMVLPNEWENEEYLTAMKQENYDLGYFNCPCSSLSTINRNASVDGDKNVHFYRVYNIVKNTQPKTFIIENAPTLIKLGYPLIKDMYNNLGETYNFTVIRDLAGNHGVAMKRMRTLIVGWRKDVFDNKIPLLHMNKQKKTTVKDVIGDLYNVPVNSPEVKNHNLYIENKGWSEIEHLFDYVTEESSALLSFIDNWDTLSDKIDNELVINEVLRAKEKLSKDQRIWDKTPWRSAEHNTFPSMTSVTRIIHPTLNRTLTIREYARIMGYPDDFEFHNGCNTNIITVICQGVPVNFIKYIATEAREALNDNRELVDDANVIFQHHTQSVWKKYTLEEAKNLDKFDYENSKEVYNDLKK